MKKLKVFSVKEPIFKTEPLFVYGCSYEQMHRYLRRRFKTAKLKEKEVNEDPGTASTIRFSGPPWRVVWFEKINKRSLESHGEIVHELFHLVVRICEDKGIPIKANIETGECGDETAAYLMDFFMREVWRRV